MADTTLSYVNAPDITIDEAFVGLSGAVPTIDITAAIAAQVAASEAAAVAASEAAAAAEVDLLAAIRCDLITGATGTTYSFIPRRAGTLTNVDCVLDGAKTATGAASVAVTIAGAAVVLSGAVSFAIGSVSGATVSRTVSSGGAYTAGQTIRITTTSANTAATFGTVSLAGTRA